MLNQKPINILVSYIKTPSVNGFRALAEQTLEKDLPTAEIIWQFFRKTLTPEER